MTDEAKKARPLVRVFVTGGSGFIGSALVNHLVTQHLRIRCLVHKSPITVNAPDLDTVTSDLADFEWKELESFQPDVIYHFARIPGQTRKSRTEAAKRNARANKALIKWMKMQLQPPLLVFGSGTLVYGNQDEKRADESTELNPISFQKEYFKAELPILDSMEKTTLPIIIVRPPWIYSHGSWFEWFFINHMKKNNSIPQYGSGKNFMSLIHLEDCAGLIHHIGKYGVPGNTYNITGHTPIRQHQFVVLLQEISGLHIKKYSYPYMWLKFEKAARKALTSSLKSDTQHRQLYENYHFTHPELFSGLRSVLKNFDF